MIWVYNMPCIGMPPKQPLEESDQNPWAGEYTPRVFVHSCFGMSIPTKPLILVVLNGFDLAL